VKDNQVGIQKAREWLASKKDSSTISPHTNSNKEMEPTLDVHREVPPSW
jgi:hypothetical protein